jgi:predicted YcjX-like family ATPase
VSIGRSLDRVSGAVAQQLNRRVDIATTGLRPSGKTIFIAALDHNLKTFNRTGALAAFAPRTRFSV